METQILRTQVAGVNVHKEMLAITVLRGAADAEPEVIQFECSTFTQKLIDCGRKLLDLGVRQDDLEGPTRS